ncbi:MAG: hypothetical protein A2474_07870 [Elusimicrobia bacterium RIFOXYC2_FULL_34_12]|nr:MAG: hypothetical protein A2474_07870 [Elusimicrobia bacterium RIFOXYC2_FULL_34_12]OGS37954.1 MAG: hypothetical protein A2551_04395 [Elusimicrobia bacterium RIFOXYD2_FULL_34_30]HAM39587.1 hypothetical protein [Elusimicrobiota bacterium]
MKKVKSLYKINSRFQISNFKFRASILKMLLFFIFMYFLTDFNCLHSQQNLQEIEVKAGDTLWGVATHYLKEPSRWPEILNFNDISADPNNVLPGMKLKIPIVLIKEQLRSSTVTSIIREVKVRRQVEINWAEAKQNMKLYNKDCVRTLENSYAGIKSPLGNSMTIGPSSLVIIQPEEKTDETRLLSGEIRATNIPIRTPTAFVMPRITPKTPISDYKTKVKEDQSTIVAVYKGAVDVTAKNKTVTVPEGYSTEVKINLPPIEPRQLPPSMELLDEKQRINKEGKLDMEKPKIGKLNKPNIENINEINIGGELSKSKSASEWLDITHYHIQIAKDKDFNDIVFDSVRPIYEKFDIKKTEVTDGRYFWRVSYLDASGAEGIISSYKEILVDKTPPTLTIEEPIDNGRYVDKNVRVSGTTEPDGRVNINGNYVTVDRYGKFSAEVSLIKGENIIKVSSNDKLGNTTTISLKVIQTPVGIRQQVKKSFFLTPVGIVISIITISALLVISLVTVTG